MSARERVLARCLAPGQWVVEGWTVTRRKARYPLADRWSARYDDAHLVGPTLEDVCGQIIDHDDEHRGRAQ